MGTYGISAQEICDEIIDAVENMEGDFDIKTLNQGFKLANAKKGFIHTTDRCICSKCEEPFKIRGMSFKCPHCGKDN